MATKGREPLTGLLGAVQQLSPTIPTSFGTTPVQVQQAIPWQETGIGKLSQALGLTVQGLSVAKDIGEIREQEAIEDIEKLNFDEFQTFVKENKEKYGTQVRTNKIPFLGNPWNQEAVREAAGARYHDEYQLRLNTELQKSNTLETTQAVIDRVYQGMVDDFEITDPTVKRGFDVSIRGLNQKASLQYDTLKNNQANKNVLLHGESALYEASSTPDTYGEIDEWWDKNQATFRPAELIQLIKDVAVRHATDGNEEAAKEFLNYAARYLPVGQRTLEDGKVVTDLFAEYTSEVADIREEVEKAADLSENKQQRDAAEFLVDVSAEAGQVAFALSQGRTYQLDDGTEITSKEQYTALINERAAGMNNPYAQAQLFATLKQSYTGAESMTNEEAGVNLMQDLQQVRLGIGMQLKSVKESVLTKPEYLQQSPDPAAPGKINPALQALANNLESEYVFKSTRKAQEIVQGSYIDIKGERVVGASKNKQFNDLFAFNETYAEEYRQELERIISEQKASQRAASAVAKIGTDTGKSFTDPSGEPLKDKVAELGNVEYFTKGLSGLPVNIDEIEYALRNGNNQRAKDIAKFYDRDEPTSLQTAPARLPFFPIETPSLSRDLRKLRTPSVSPEQREKARRSVLVWAYASEGSNFYSPEAIRKGVVNIKGQEVQIDKESLLEMVNILPIISKDRVLDISKGGDQDIADIYELYNALYDQSIEYDDKASIDPNIATFIDKQKALYEKR